jgi:hypothetical protein
VEINLKFLDAPDLCRETREEMDELCGVTGECRARVSARVYDHLGE